jgi:hypothetical protein
MKSRVPEPVTVPAGGGTLEVEVAVDVASALFGAEEGGAASTKAEAGSPPKVSESPAFSA